VTWKITDLWQQPNKKYLLQELIWVLVTELLVWCIYLSVILIELRAKKMNTESPLFDGGSATIGIDWICWPAMLELLLRGPAARDHSVFVCDLFFF
jgi:hypothetical protein